jgi:phosphomannomutase / phosphoglucomutase
MARIPEHVFREYDIRGLVGPELTPDFAAALGRGFATYLLERTSGAAQAIVVGHDHRPSSAPFAAAFGEGARSRGIDVLALGVVPTPLSYFAAHVLPVDGLCMITGSHNPPEYNGFKLGVGRSTFVGHELQELKRQVFAGGGAPAKRQGSATPFDVVAPYLHFVSQLLGPARRRLRVVVDAGNATAGLVAPKLLRALGHDVVELFTELDGTFPNHHPDPTVPANLVDLQRRVAEERADLGVAYDGDADRLGAVDEQGRILWGDQLMVLFSRDVLRERPGATIISEVKSSQTLYDDIERHGGRGIMWKVGHSLIKSKMKEEHALLAGEMSGHLFFRHRWFGFDDGIYASARLVELLSRSDGPLSSLLADVPRTFVSPEIRKDFPDEKKFAAVELAREKLRKHGRTVEVDGVRLIVDGGWGLVRASNTQPILVLRWEADSPERLARIAELIESTVEEVRRELHA